MCKKEKDYGFSEQELLREFVMLVDELNAASMSKILTSQDGVVLITRAGDWANGEILNFNEEHCRAFLLIFRLLYQSNDNLSVRFISEIIANGDFSADEKAQVAFARMIFNGNLDEPQIGNTTNREAIEVFLWGAYAHRCHNAVKRREFLAWQQEKDTFMIRKQSFIFGLKLILGYANMLSDTICRGLSDEANEADEK